MRSNSFLKARGGVLARALFTSSIVMLGTTSVVAHAQEAANPPAASGDADASQAPVITVTGTRLKTGMQTPTPVTMLSSDTIEDRAPVNIAQVTAQLPQVKSTNTAITAKNGIGTATVNYVDMRGLRWWRTLTLIDGHRGAPNPLLNNGVDSNQIPTLMVSRVDTITGGASAQYGTDAVAGVINFVLKDKYEGIEALVQRGVSQEGDNVTGVYSILAGHTFGDSGLRFVASAEYATDDGVGTILTRDWGRKQAGLLAQPANRAAGTPAQVWADNVAFSTVAPTGLVSSGPLRGLAFTNDGQPRTFDFGTGVFSNQMVGSRDNIGDCVNCYNDLSAPYKRFASIAKISYEVGDTTLWAEANYYKLTSRSRSGLAYQPQFVVLIDNPFLPASVKTQMQANGLDRITVGRDNIDIGPPGQAGYSRQWGGAIGAKGKIGSWAWDTYLQYNNFFMYNAQAREVDRPNYLAAVYAVRAADGSIQCGPTATNPNLSAIQKPLVTAGCVPFNPFIMNAPNSASIAYVTNTEVLPSSLTQVVGGINVAGNLIDLPAGPVAVAFGFEAYDHNGKVVGFPRTLQDPHLSIFNVGNNTPYAGRQSVYEFYGEAEVPILKDTTLFHTLSVNGAVRQAHYNNIGSHTTWKVGGIWEPVEGIKFRASQSQDIRAPSFAEYGQGFVSPENVTNPILGTSAVLDIQRRPGSYIGLGPELSKTFSAGVVLAPQGFIPGLRASVDYFNIRINNAIQRPTAPVVINQCLLNKVQTFCNLLVQDNSALGFSEVNDPNMNLGILKVQGFDIELTYTTSLDKLKLPGKLSFRALATNTSKYTTTVLGSVTNNTGVLVPTWKYNAEVSYDSDVFSTYFQFTGFNHTRFSPTLLGPDQAGYDPTKPNSISSNLFPARTYVNWGASVNVQEHFKLTFTVDNLLNTDPPSNSLYSNSAVYDSIGRTFRVGVRVKY